MRREGGWEGRAADGLERREQGDRKEGGMKRSRRERDGEGDREGERAISKQRLELYLEWLELGSVHSLLLQMQLEGSLCYHSHRLHLGPSSKLPWGHLSPAVTVQHANNGWCSGLRREGGD